MIYIYEFDDYFSFFIIAPSKAKAIVKNVGGFGDDADDGDDYDDFM